MGAPRSCSPTGALRQLDQRPQEQACDHDADDRLIYNTTTGALYYDKDGNGSKAAVQIALLELVNGIAPTLAYDDFIFS
jgi:Ca2+-binding RTX toxin-like protein